LAQRYSPEAEPREPIKPLRIRDEEPGGLLGILVWWRKRGGVFWWTTILVFLSIGTLVGVLVPVARGMGHLDFRPAPDMTATISADNTAVSKGDTITLTVTHRNEGGSEAGAVTVDIELPNELKVTSVVPGTPACSQAGKLERFASQEVGEITGEWGGNMLCLLGTRVTGAQGSITLEAEVGDVADGSNMNVDVWLSTYQTDTVAKDEDVWANNCTSLQLVAGSSAGSSTGGTLDCNSLAFVARSIEVETIEKAFTPGEPLTLVISHENVGGLDSEAVTLDIWLPNELTAGNLLQLVDERALAGEPTCSHPNQLEEFASEGKGRVTNTPGGTMTCTVAVGSRTIGARAEIEIQADVAQVVSGSTINVNVCARRELDASAATSDCTMLEVPVKESS
jgi:uncharacterized repeat protein (TIGR01451 family)